MLWWLVPGFNRPLLMKGTKELLTLSSPLILSPYPDRSREGRRKEHLAWFSTKHAVMGCACGSVESLPHHQKALAPIPGNSGGGSACLLSQGLGGEGRRVRSLRSFWAILPV